MKKISIRAASVFTSAYGWLAAGDEVACDEALANHLIETGAADERPMPQAKAEEPEAEPEVKPEVKPNRGK